MRYKILFMFFVSIAIFAFVSLTHSKTPFFLVNGYDEFYNLYHFEDDVELMVFNNEKDVSYYLKLSEDVSVDILGTRYDEKDIFLLDIDPSHENTYLDIFVYDKSHQLLDESRFYYAVDLDDLTFLNWSFVNPVRQYIFVFVFVFIIELITLSLYEWSKKQNQKNENTENQVTGKLERIKSFSIAEKIVYGFLLLIYIVFPQILIFPLAFVFIIYVVINMKNFKYRLYAILAMIPMFAIGILVFAGFLFLTTPSSFDNYYKYTSLHMTQKEESLYKRLIDELDFYKLDPILVQDDDLSLVGIYGYRRSYWFNRDPFDQSVLYLIPYQISSTYDHVDVLVLNHNLVIFNRQSIHNQIDKTIEINIPQSVRSVTIEFRTDDNILLYRSEVIVVASNRLDYPEPIYFGGQYQEKPLRTWIMNAIGVHLGFMVVMTLAYGLSKRFDYLLIKKTK